MQGPKAWLRRLLCLIGLHDWEVYTGDSPVLEATRAEFKGLPAPFMGAKIRQVRACHRCPRVEILWADWKGSGEWRRL